MKRLVPAMALIVLVSMFAGCAGTKPAAVNIPEDPQEKLVWSSQPERPGWVYNEPETENRVLSFVGLSNRYATEKLAREDARRSALSNIVQYMGALVKDDFERASTDFGLAADVINPTASAKIFEEQLAVNMANRVKVNEVYMEKWQTPTGVGYQAFMLAKVSQESLEDSYRATAKEMARKAEQQAKKANDQIAKDQAQMSADFWTQMERRGMIE